jgi:type IV secretion system protein VirB5
MCIRINRHPFVRLAACVASTAFVPAAYAQLAVVDAAAVTQLISQMETLQEQLMTARDQLLHARAQLQSITGRRGMEGLLAGTARNYLPRDWAEIEDVLRGTSGTYGQLSTALRAAIAAHEVLSVAQLNALPQREREFIEAARGSPALLEVVAREALASTSGRFAALQQLIDAIGNAGDQKAILELQARIDAEQGMLQNEQTKLQVLYQAAQAQEWTHRQRLREQVVAGHGRFDVRFQPRPQ